MEIEEIEKALHEVGWTYNVRYTTEDMASIETVCKKILKDKNNEILDLSKRESFSLEIFNIISFQICNVQERSDMISTTYINSRNLKKIINLLDEAYLSFYKGCYTASLAVLFIALEKYLRQILGWVPGNPDPKFSELKNSVKNLPDIKQAGIAYKIINTVYSRYDSLNPTLFYFNRHGLLHGVERESKYDEMNCARLFNLFDILSYAERASRTAWGDALEMFEKRYTIYEKCQKSRLESELLLK